MNNLALILILLLFLTCVQKIDSSDSYYTLVEIERSFARTSVEKGIKDAFLTYLADDAIVFRPKPIKAKPLYATLQQNPGSLSWFPIYADVSRAGDMGYTTGPFEYRSDPDNNKADGCGFYVSIWKKQKDGVWKVMIDGGINCPCSDSTILENVFKKQRQRRVRKTVSNIDIETENVRLLATDFRFAKLESAEGIINTYRTYLADDIRLYRMGELPINGKENALKKIINQDGIFSRKPIASDVAGSGDLGYTYGLAELNSERGARKAFSYLRIWRNNSNDDWKIVVDLENPIPDENNN